MNTVDEDTSKTRRLVLAVRRRLVLVVVMDARDTNAERLVGFALQLDLEQLMAGQAKSVCLLLVKGGGGFRSSDITFKSSL